MQELRIVLIIVGIVLIIALLAHGFWSSRKNRPEKIANSKKSSALDVKGSKARDDQGFDDFGIGEVKVMGDPIDQHVAASKEAELNAKVNRPVVEQEPADLRQDPILNDEMEASAKREPELSFSAIAEEPTLETEALALEPELAVEPVLEAASVVKEECAEVIAPAEQKPEPAVEPQDPDDVFVINIMAQTHRKLKGQPLMDCLSTLGLKFGEMNIFHRHLDNAGDGPIIYSMANMVNPGTFDIDNMDKFETRGISLFMTVPCKGEPTKNFKSMYHSAQTLAKHLDALLLDDQRNPLTKQTVNHYEQRLREFERQQLLKSHAN